MRRISLALVALVVLSGCAAPYAAPDGAFDPDAGGEPGTVAGVAHDDVLGVEDGELSDAELEAVTYRAMARIEVLRGLEFEEDVDVEVITREEFRERATWDEEPADAFTNELWRGAFVVGGETDVNEAFGELYEDAVQGYYSGGEIVLIVDRDEDVRIDRTTLVHELVHALQDQHFGLDRHGETVDERRAEDGLVEGEAEYVPNLYDRRCETDWECLPDPDPVAAAPETRSFDVGLFLSIYAPYATGPPFVAHLVETGGWDAVDAAHDERPASTTQLIHPERYPDVRPVDVAIEDRSADGWEPMTDDGERRNETVGEATLFATLWANGALDRPLTEGAGDLARYNYSHPVTDGWVGDSFVAYSDGDRTGHVWRLAWESGDDAEAFRDAYATVLENRGAVELEDGTYRIPAGEPFGGAYEVTREDETVTIVGAPTVAELESIHGDAETTASAAPARSSAFGDGARTGQVAAA